MTVMWSRRLIPLSFRLSPSFSSTPPKVKSPQKITLFDLDGNIIGIKTMAEAEAMAKKMNLSLRRKFLPAGQTSKESPYTLFDPKSDFDAKPVSVTGDKNERKGSGVREKKRITIGANINDHDIATKAKQMSKFLKANCEVQVVCHGSVTNERLEQIFKRFESLFHELRMTQKVLKPGSLKFTILPNPEKFTGISGDDETTTISSADAEALKIDDNEIEELVNQKLKEKKG